MNQVSTIRKRHPTRIFLAVLLLSTLTSNLFGQNNSRKLFERFCFDCHNDATSEGGINLEKQLHQTDTNNLEIVFENLITGKMPPVDADRPGESAKRQMLKWLAQKQKRAKVHVERRLSRREFNHSLNDILRVDIDLTQKIPDDRGTNDFDSDRKILLTKQMLASYFKAAAQMLEFAFPSQGFLPVYTWTTNKLKDSHQTYNIYHRPYKDGLLFSWTRANNGNSYSFFYDDFEPPADGWYELTFDAAKVGQFPEDACIQVHAGKYYFADDRPQPQRLLDVISISESSVNSFTTRGFFHKGENVSVHCYSKHTWRNANPKQGVYIEKLKVTGPIQNQWPPAAYPQLFKTVQLDVPDRKLEDAKTFRSNISKIGGSISVSSFQKGMEKEKMLDGSNRTFWHTRFTPTLAKPPHFVIFDNPNKTPIEGLTYSTWTGGNGNGQVKKFEIYVSDDKETWGRPISSGELETRLANTQPIPFTKPISNRYIKFLITDFYTIDGRSLASIGKLDVNVSIKSNIIRQSIAVKDGSVERLKQVIQQFAEKAFVTSLSPKELEPYVSPALQSYAKNPDFVQAAKLGFKAVLCSHRFLVAPGQHHNKSFAKAAFLSRAIWQSVPDERLIKIANGNRLSGLLLEKEIGRMLEDEKSIRMVQSLADQWLNLRTFKKVSPSLKLYPRYDDLLDFYLPQETVQFLNHLVTNNRSVSHLIDSDFTFLNQRLAQHYGVDGVYGQRLRFHKLPAGSKRGGLLTMGSILKVTTDGFDTSPILRGAWISKNIAGNTLSPPPENVNAIEPDTSGATSIREQINLHKKSESCASCHTRIDPYGFALESFDATGQWRERYRIKKPHRGTFQYRLDGYFRLGDKVDAASDLEGEPITNIAEFKQLLLSDHKKIAYNFMKKFFEYANGYKPTLPQRIRLYASIPDEAKDCGMQDLIVSVLLQSLSSSISQ